MTTTSEPRVLTLPTAIPAASAIGDPTLDEAQFQRGYDDASTYLGSLPHPWAIHHASTTLADGQIPDISASYERGYRAALYGFRRHGRR